jgi:ABC-type Zn uptake system ZnuABC Zn-binding protein ZnuA
MTMPLKILKFAACKSPVRCCLLTLSLCWTALATFESGVSTSNADELKICVSSPDAKSLIESIGGDLVNVTSFSRGSQDPHQIQIRPSFVKAVKEADLVVWIGQGLESAWKERLLRQAGSEKVMDGQPGSLDLGSTVIAPEEPEDEDGEEEEEGGFHEEGNPHYMLDPWEGLKAARRITLKLSEINPASSEKFRSNFSEWAQEWKTVCFGDSSKAEDWEAFLDIQDSASLETKFQSWLSDNESKTKGLFGEMKSVSAEPLVGDHDLWVYVAKRFELNIVGYIEGHPGAPPTTGHLTKLAQNMKSAKVKVILQSPYFPKRYIQFLERSTQAKPIMLAHQTEATKEATSYLKMIESNLKKMIQATR